MTDTFILIISIGIMNILCFFIGAKIGQKVVKGENIELPKIEPIKAFKEFNVSREVMKMQERDKLINENIDNYNGTSLGQKDLPR